MPVGDIHVTRKFLYPAVACGMLLYVYLEVVSRLSSKPIIVLYNNEDLLTEVKPNISRKNVQYILRLRNTITELNQKLTVENEKDCNWQFNMIIVIKVHRRRGYLKELIESLQRANGIGYALLLFSHGYYDEYINRMVRNITFARVKQIYYPYSVQLHPYVFPGNDRKTCDPAMACQISRRKAVTNQHKHHWWWTANFVFDKFSASEKYNSSILFLEEDQYVTADFIYIFRILEGLLKNSNRQLDILSLGSGISKVSWYRSNNTSILVKPFKIEDTVGIAFNKTTWQTMKNLSQHFCRYNDNRWYISLAHLASRVKRQKFNVLAIKGARVFRFNKCKRGNFCNETEKIEQLHKFVSKIQNGLFPKKLHVHQKDSQEEVKSGNGGWADARDHELCLYFTSQRKVTP